MSLTASTLISAAKDRTFSYHGKQKLNDKMLLAELSYQDQLVVQLVSQANPDLLATVSGTITMSDSGNSNGYTLQSGVHYRDFTHIDSTDDRYTPINIVQRQHRDVRPAAPAGMVRTSSAAGVFYPIDPAGKRWSGSETRNWFEPDSSHTVSYSYVPLPGTLSSLSATLSSPDMAREVFVTALEVAILLSARPQNEIETASWQTRLEAALGARQAALEVFRMQVYKFVNPQGNPGSEGASLSESEWVHDQVTS